MLIEAGFDVAFECPAATPMILQLSIHPSRDADLLTPDRIVSDPFLPMRSYLDLFGNRVTRVEVPAGLVTFSGRFIIQDRGEPDETSPDVRTTPIADLPDETLLFLLPSRYCDSDKLADFAWSQFGKLSGALCVQAICDFVHAKIRFSYPDASPTRCAGDSMHEGIGVCRDFAHLAIALCRCMNIPARCCTGYLGDIGVPIDINPMDFSAWFEVFLAGRWYTKDARHNHPRIGRIVMGRGRDAADVAMSTAFGVANLVRFEVVTQEQVEHGQSRTGQCRTPPKDRFGPCPAMVAICANSDHSRDGLANCPSKLRRHSCSARASHCPSQLEPWMSLSPRFR